MRAVTKARPAKREQLLLVEDDDAIADVLHLHLQKAGYGVQRVADGNAAIVALDRQPWDLVLLDVMLPGIDGWAVCRHLRAAHAGIPVIILSAHSAQANRILGLDLGADDYIAKPFSMLELIARVRALLRRVNQPKTPAATVEVLRFGRFVLDLGRRELRDGIAGVPLTLREFELLSFLTRHQGRAFSRYDLLLNVWGDGYDGYEHTVNSHINRLRTKIEDDPHDPRHIVTIWGLGYRFDDVASASC